MSESSNPLQGHMDYLDNAVGTIPSDNKFYQELLQKQNLSYVVACLRRNSTKIVPV